MRIPCTIRTPQHADGCVHHYHTQEGIFDDVTLKFEPYRWAGGDHSVQFTSVAQWRECTVAQPRKLQFIFWWNKVPRLGFARYRVGDHHTLAFQLYYNWSIQFGWWEVRQFKSDRERDAALTVYLAQKDKP